MRIELEIEETHELFVFLADRLVEEAGLDEADRAALRTWRVGMTPGSDGMRELAEKMNADLARVLVNKKKSHVKKADWR